MLQMRITISIVMCLSLYFIFTRLQLQGKDSQKTAQVRDFTRNSPYVYHIGLSSHVYSYKSKTHQQDYKSKTHQQDYKSKTHQRGCKWKTYQQGQRSKTHQQGYKSKTHPHGYNSKTHHEAVSQRFQLGTPYSPLVPSCFFFLTWQKRQNRMMIPVVTVTLLS